MFRTIEGNPEPVVFLDVEAPDLHDAVMTVAPAVDPPTR